MVFIGQLLMVLEATKKSMTEMRDYVAYMEGGI